MAKRLTGIFVALVSTLGVLYWLFCIFSGRVGGKA